MTPPHWLRRPLLHGNPNESNSCIILYWKILNENLYQPDVVLIAGRDLRNKATTNDKTVENIIMQRTYIVYNENLHDDHKHFTAGVLENSF